MLSSFEIKNFRTFSHLRIERLGRVNLIVGKNNVGKTTLLEALRFYAMKSATALREILADHDELERIAAGVEAQLDLMSLFHGRSRKPEDISLGPLNDPDQTLSIRLIDIERVEESAGHYYEEFEPEAIVPEGAIMKGVVFQRNDTRIVVPREVTQRAIGHGRYVGPAFISAQGVRESDLSQWWDEISLTNAEERVTEAISIVAPVQRITTVGDPLQRGGRIFKTRIQDLTQPVPLKSLGGGVFRMFQIAVGIEYAHHVSQREAAPVEPAEESWQPGNLLLIDEVENGVHHTLHADLWRFVFRLARELDLQVFATSHSWDCLEGFAEAVAGKKEDDALAIRLEKKEGQDKTRVVIINKEELPIVARDRIEVR